ncbi:MAG: DUF6046 domain-containing protein [Shewanella sp.]
MAELRFDLTQLYQRAFGLVRLPYPTLVVEAGLTGINNPVQTVKAFASSLGKSKLGGDYYFPLSVYRKNNDGSDALDKNAYTFPNEPTFQISGAKQIIETKVNRYDGKVVYKQNVLEEFNLENYRVRLRGVIVNEDNFDEYPEVEVMKMKAIFELPGSLAVKDCQLLNIHRIYRLAFEKIKWTEVVGAPSVQGYEIDCLSDQDFDLEYAETQQQITQ